MKAIYIGEEEWYCNLFHFVPGREYEIERHSGDDFEWVYIKSLLFGWIKIPYSANWTYYWKVTSP